MIESGRYWPGELEEPAADWPEVDQSDPDPTYPYKDRKPEKETENSDED